MEINFLIEDFDPDHWGTPMNNKHKKLEREYPPEFLPLEINISKKVISLQTSGHNAMLRDIFPNFIRNQKSFSIKNLRQIIGIYCLA